MSELGEFLKFLQARLAEEGLVLRAWPMHMLRLLATRYANHPDYREEWKP